MQSEFREDYQLHAAAIQGNLEGILDAVRGFSRSHTCGIVHSPGDATTHSVRITPSGELQMFIQGQGEKAPGEMKASELSRYRP